MVNSQDTKYQYKALAIYKILQETLPPFIVRENLKLQFPALTFLHGIWFSPEIGYKKKW